MKTLVIIFSVIGLLTFNSCNQKTDTKAILDNPDSRKEIFSTIAGDHDLMTEFMEDMHGNNHAMQMMQGNKKMMDSMMQGEGMQMMMKDSTMMNGMMNDSKMMGNMMKMMNEKGMMSKECMESCTKMMSEKGMDMKGMNKMGNMDASAKEDHLEHH